MLIAYILFNNVTLILAFYDADRWLTDNAEQVVLPLTFINYYY